MTEFPRLRPVADTGVLLEFGDRIDDDIHAQVLAMDCAVLDANINGVTELIPAYAALLVQYDPLITNYVSLCEQLTPLLGKNQAGPTAGKYWKIPVCYDTEFAPDLAQLADALGQSQDFVTQTHASAIYKVYMYGFAPGYAYLGGVPDTIQHPRKSAPTMGVAPKSVMVAGSQALITTVTMPSGWWVIGRSGINPLQANSDNPFMFAIGDTVGFELMSRADFDKYGQG